LERLDPKSRYAVLKRHSVPLLLIGLAMLGYVVIVTELL
jgi:hypothetical protein